MLDALRKIPFVSKELTGVLDEVQAQSKQYPAPRVPILNLCKGYNNHDYRTNNHRDVEVRAYYLWQSAGRPLGMRTPEESWQDHFWKAAERLIFNEEAWNTALKCASSPC